MLLLFPLLLLSSLEAVSGFKRRGPEQSIGEHPFLFPLFIGNTETKVPSYLLSWRESMIPDSATHEKPPPTGFLEVSHGLRRPMLHHHPALLAAKWAVGIAGREQNATYGN